MNVSSRVFSVFSLLAAAVLALSFSLSALAATEGKEFVRIPQKQVDAPAGKIEVIDFFSYGCGHCAQLNPIINEWKKTLPDDVVFHKVPVAWGRDAWKALGRAYFTIEALGDSALDDKAFVALQQQRINIHEEKGFLDWMADNGIDRKKAEEMYKSFAISSKLTKSEKLEKDYQVNSVPHFYVNGNMEVKLDAIGSSKDFTRVLDEIIEIARQENNKKKK
jgi:Thiol-disulfide isomerase and thioredoxins